VSPWDEGRRQFLAWGTRFANGVRRLPEKGIR
jgi:hypothetical protein